MVRARISSKLANVSGPAMNATIGAAFCPVTPGVTSTSTTERAQLGQHADDGERPVTPPSDMPTTTARVDERRDHDRHVGGVARRSSTPLVPLSE